MDSNKYFRSFTFYNDRNNNFRHKLEENKKGKNIFRTLGYFDEFKTEKIYVEQMDGDMDFLWKRINSMNENLIGFSENSFNDASFQNIFGYPCNYCLNSNEHEVSDEKFWNEEEYAYTFVILVQFFSKDENNITIEQKIESYKQRFCEHVDINLSKYKSKFICDEKATYPIIEVLDGERLNSNYIFTDYMTFDRYDYILSVKANCYLPFVLAMQQLYSLYSNDKKLPIALNSFTVTAIGKDKNLINETVPSICIKCNYDENNIFSYNEQNSYEARFNVFYFLNFFDKNQLSKVLYPNLSLKDVDHRLYYISGEDDVRIIAREIEMRNLFKLFDDESILQTEYLYGFSTVINVFYDCGIAKEYEIKFSKSEIENEIRNCSRLIHKLVDRYPSELIKTLFQINSGLSAIRPLNGKYRGYGFYSLFVEFKRFLQLLDEFIDAPKESIIKKTFTVTHSFGSALLTTVRSDFREFQIPTFNANLYYAPTKMLVFYRAFITKLIELYSSFNEGSTEHFIINTGNEIATRVREMLSIKNSDDTIEKIFVCNMSEKNIYMFKNSMVQLNHEVAHFGLRKIRNRVNRINYIANSYLKAYITTFKFYLTNEISNSKELSNEVKNRCMGYINESDFILFFMNKIKIIYLKFFKFDSNKQSYMDETIIKIKSTIKHSENEFIELITDNLLDHFCFDMKDDINCVFQQYNSLRGMIGKSFRATGQALLSEPSTNQMDSYDFFITYYFKECFADVVAILTLNLTPADYLSTLLKVSDATGRGTVIDRLVSRYRFYIIFNSINNILNKKCINIEQNEFFENNKFILEWDSKICVEKYDKESAVHYIVDRFNKYLSDSQINLLESWYNNKNRTFLKNVMENFECNDYLHAAKFFSVFYYDKNIFDNFVNYLVDCIQLYINNYGNIEKFNSKFSPCEIYKNISSEKKNIDEKIIFIDSLLSDFESKCYYSLTEAKKGT